MQRPNEQQQRLSSWAINYFYRAFVPYQGFLVEFPMSGCPQSLLPHSAPYVSFCAAALNPGVPRQAPCVVNCTTCTPVHPLNILTHLLNCSLSSSKQWRAFFYSNLRCAIMCPSELVGASVYPKSKLLQYHMLCSGGKSF